MTTESAFDPSGPARRGSRPVGLRADAELARPDRRTT